VNAMAEQTLETLAGTVLERSRSGRSLTVCLGAGVSIAAGMPSWNSLVKELVEQRVPLAEGEVFKNEVSNYPIDISAGELLDFIAKDIGAKTIVDYIRAKTEHLQPTELHAALAKLPASTFITTNYDTLLEKTFSSLGERFNVVMNDEDVSLLNAEKPAIIKLHGSIENPQTIVFSLKKEPTSRENREVLDSYLRALFATSLVLFVGYSVQEEWFQELYERYRGSPESAANWVVLTPAENLLTKRLWESRGVRFVEVSTTDMPAFIRILSDQLQNKTKIEQPTKSKRTVFVSGSAESLPIINQIEMVVSTAGFEPITSENFFTPSKTIFESLNELTQNAIAAVVVLSPDGQRARTSLTSQNVLFELGYLTGRLGRDRVMAVVHRDISNVPSDLAGVSFAVADFNRPRVLSSLVQDWLSKLSKTPSE